MAQSLYTTETPTSETSESPGPTVGTVIKIGVAGWQVTRLKWFAPAESTGGDGAIPFVLYDADTQAELVRKVAAITLGAWNVVTLDTPVPVSLNQRIMPSVKTPTRYTFTAGFFATTDLVVGDLTAPATGNTTGGNGRFHTGGDAYPEGTFGGNNYWTDIVLEQIPSSDAISPSSVALPLALGAPALAGPGLAISPGSTVLPLALGPPALAGPGLAAGPGSVSLPLALGAPTLSQAFAIAPGGLSLPLGLGAPTVGTAFHGEIAPDSLALPLALGAPALRFHPPEGGNWESLLGVLEAARGDAAVDRERERNPLDCPIHGWPLERARGMLHCKFGGHTL